jgi:hypothetical protein
MGLEHQALIEAPRRAHGDRVAVVDALLAESRAAIVAEGIDPIALRAFESLATERALLDALDANTERMLRVFEEAAA